MRFITKFGSSVLHHFITKDDSDHMVVMFEEEGELQAYEVVDFYPYHRNGGEVTFLGHSKTDRRFGESVTISPKQVVLIGFTNRRDEVESALENPRNFAY